MNELPPPDQPGDDVDELLSAYVDHEATAEERARVEGSPDLVARATAVRAIRAAMAEPPPIDGDRREQSILAALDAAQMMAPVVSLERARAGRTRQTSWMARSLGPALGAAAVVVVVVLAVTNKGDESKSSSATGASRASKSVEVAASTTAAAAAGSGPAVDAQAALPSPVADATTAGAAATTAGAATTTAAAASTTATAATTAAATSAPANGLRDLGQLTSTAQLVDALPAASRVVLPPSSVAAACRTPAGTDAPAATALWLDAPALIYVEPVDAADPARLQAVVLDRHSCRVLVTVPLP